MIVFLYEDLRYKLIKIIDDNVNLDEILSADYIELIKRQQDIIDEYLRIFNLKKHVNFDVNMNNINNFEYENKGDFVQRNFGVTTDAMRQTE